MKFNNIFKYAVIAVAAGTLVGVSSCNYLDVVPPEQPSLPDAMKNHNAALGFLYSCYAGINNVNAVPTEYTSPMCSTTDEYVIPNAQATAYPAILAASNNTQTTSLSNIHWLWGSMYQYIGQCLLFEQQYEELGRENGVADSQKQEDEWLAEIRFLKAYYHYALIRCYGPVPLTLELIPMDSDAGEFPGRSHFDYCVNYVCSELDQAAADLPGTRDPIEFGRATSVMAKAIKARLLLLAASDLFNGKFPYPEWRNTNYETPGYGAELVSKTYDRSKWQRAYDATLEAIEFAEANGHTLMKTYAEESEVTLDQMAWVPVDFENAADKEEFLTKVMLHRYIHSTSQSENPEILWSLKYTHGSLEDARLPLKIIANSNGQWYNWGWSVVNPTLNTVYNFYCKDGLLPAQGHPDIDFATRNEWFKRATDTASGHEDIINLMRNREPRFYAWIAFDGGNYLNRIKNGEALTLDFKSSEKQGYQPANEPKNYTETGLLAQKHITPIHSITKELTRTRGTEHPIVMIRLTELYLNLAECAAELAKEDASYEEIALFYLNEIRKRAGIPELDEDMLNQPVTNPIDNSTKTMTLLEWVRQERFIELWDEGQRYYDIRRWVAGSEYLGSGKRQGLNGCVVDPSFEEFNTPTVINPTYTFGARQYIYPVFINECYKNPQMVQAPGF